MKLTNKKGTVILLIVSFAVLFSIFILFGIDPTKLTGREAYIGKVSLDVLQNFQHISKEQFLLEEKARIAEDNTWRDLQNFSLCTKDNRTIYDFSSCYPTAEKVEDEFFKNFLFYLNKEGEMFQLHEINITGYSVIGRKKEPSQIITDRYTITYQKGFVIQTTPPVIFEDVMKTIQSDCIIKSVDSIEKMKSCFGKNVELQEDTNYIKFDIPTDRIIRGTGEYFHFKFSVEKNTIKKEGGLF